jgi:hypothetical protein
MIGIHDPNLRITFDTNIEWSTDQMDLRKIEDGQSILKEGEALMEIKVSESMPMELARELSKLQIFPVSFSKYGRGYIQMMEGRIETSKVPVDIEQKNETVSTLSFGRGVTRYA